MSLVEKRLNNFRNTFEEMTLPQKMASLSRLQVFITAQMRDPVIYTSPLVNQVENHFRTSARSVDAGWWNMLNRWEMSPLVERILGEV